MTAEHAPPNALLAWTTPPTVVLFAYERGNALRPPRPTLVGETAQGRSCRAKKVAQYHGVAGVRFVLADGQLDAQIVAVVPNQPCEIVPP